MNLYPFTFVSLQVFTSAIANAQAKVYMKLYRGNLKHQSRLPSFIEKQNSQVGMQQILTISTFERPIPYGGMVHPQSLGIYCI